MEKKGSSDNIESRGRGRRETSERKPEQAESKDQGDIGGGDAPAPKNRRRRAGGDENGWMSSNSSGPGSRHASSVAAPVEEEEPRESQAVSANRDKHLQDDNDEIVLIPDLDEDGGADADQRIAHAPRNVNRRIPTLKDLENEVKAAVPTSEEGLNLAVLLATLVPAGMVKEEDTAWTFESLLREVTDELSNTPKTVIEVITPATPVATAASAAAAKQPSGVGKGEGGAQSPTPQAEKSRAGKASRQDRDRDREKEKEKEKEKERLLKGAEGSNKNKK